MRITVEDIDAIIRDIETKLDVEIYREENKIKDGGVYLTLEFIKTDSKSRSGCNYFKYNLSVNGVGYSTPLTAKIMSLESDLIEFSFMSGDVYNIESFQKVNSKLRWSVLWNDDEGESNIENNNLTYKKDFELTIFIGG